MIGPGAGPSVHLSPPEDVPYPPVFFRLARLLGLPLRALDEWSWDDIFDEMEVTHYLLDLDQAIERARNPAAFSA